ncbi:uncharacterized protein AMSG_01112 [Thecamonas trahens ATCC 50062]|uniref:Arrestin C-terminal-like domain-containing protein n=1 Tax=Thecamonas trahens ATCC 50062 TaxID=461836 RepID=A0A0L0DJA3_THETB|nr:hypothetical protein AMSG_01112 [Thecamonas trahens ATCC 50062]KNC52285.1 hypothetical protein AMSG_01112 [Thecamonas trahens ATCC 50062]|eukprot:XP_013762284.1 hypothetical protein AMSG_01112 [Thecamonas trahens ATCC 50062]
MSVTITLDNAPPGMLYQAGDVVAGVVTIVVTGRETTHYGVFLNVGEEEECKWEATEVKHVNVESSKAKNSRLVLANESGVPSGKVAILDTVSYSGSSSASTSMQIADSGVLQPGSHSFPFRFQLSPALSSTIDGVSLPRAGASWSAASLVRGSSSPASGKAVIGVHATMKRAALKSNWRAHTSLRVAARHAPELMNPVSASESKTFLMHSGALDMTLSLPRSVAVATEVLQPALAINNGSTKNVNTVTLQFVQISTFHASTPSRRRTEEEVLASMSFPGAPAGTSINNVYSLALPPDLQPSRHGPSTNSSGRAVVTNRYELRAACNVSMGFDLVARIPISIFHHQVFYLPPPMVLDERVLNADERGAELFRQLVPTRGPSQDLADPSGCELLVHGVPLSGKVVYRSYRMYWIDVGAVPPPTATPVPAGSGKEADPGLGVPALRINARGSGKSSLVVRYMKDNQPSQLGSSHGSATDLGGYQYELVIRAPDLVPGRYYIGVWGNQFLPPTSTYTIEAQFLNGARSLADVEAEAAAAAAASSSAGPPSYDDLPPTDAGYAPPRYTSTAAGASAPPPMSSMPPPPSSSSMAPPPSASPYQTPPPDASSAPSAPPPAFNEQPPAYQQ